MKKILKKISIIVPVIVILALSVVGICYFNEIRTLLSVKPIEGTNLYTMEYVSDYRFDEFLETGASNNKEYYDYINNMINTQTKLKLANSQAASDACTAFTFRDKDGGHYLARNYDNKANPVMLVATAPRGGYKSISAVNMTCMGYNNEKVPSKFDINTLAAPYFPTDGVNEKGISVAVLQVNFARKQKSDNHKTIGIFAAVRLVLDHADSLDNAVALIDQYNIYFDTAFMAQFFIADKDGNSALVEFVDGKMYVIKNENPSFQVASNFNNMEEQFSREGYVKQHEYRKWLTASDTTAYDSEYSGYIRYDFVYDSLYNISGIMSESDGFELLEYVASPDNLQYSVIYRLDKAEATIITDNDWEKKTTVAVR